MVQFSGGWAFERRRHPVGGYGERVVQIIAAPEGTHRGWGALALAADTDHVPRPTTSSPKGRTRAVLQTRATSNRLILLKNRRHARITVLMERGSIPLQAPADGALLFACHPGLIQWPPSLYDTAETQASRAFAPPRGETRAGAVLISRCMQRVRRACGGPYSPFPMSTGNVSPTSSRHIGTHSRGLAVIWVGSQPLGVLPVGLALCRLWGMQGRLPAPSPWVLS